jgi:hypothetical protein
MESSHPSFRTVPYSVCLSIERDRMDEDFNKGAKWIPDFIKTPYIIQYFLLQFCFLSFSPYLLPGSSLLAHRSSLCGRLGPPAHAHPAAWDLARARPVLARRGIGDMIAKELGIGARILEVDRLSRGLASSLLSGFSRTQLTHATHAFPAAAAMMGLDHSGSSR